MKAIIGDMEIEGTPSEIGELLMVYRRRVPTTTKVDGIRPNRDVQTGVFKPKDPVVIPFSKHRRNKPWTKKEDTYLLLKHAEGRKHRLIAKDLGRTVGAIDARLYDLNHPGRAQRGLATQSRKHKGWTANEDALLKKSIEDGASHATIARLLGRTTQAVRIRAQRKGRVKP